MYIKRFFEWVTLKQKLDTLTSKPPFVNEGDIWWVSIGENVGSEICGKSNEFARPVIILKKLSYGFFIVVPSTGKKRKGSWYVQYRHRGLRVCACLHQTRALDHRRLLNKVGRLDDSDFRKIKQAYIKLIR